jgi:hypothetical protein
MKWHKERLIVSSSPFSLIIEKFFYRNGGWKRLKGELSVYYWPQVAGNEIAKKVEAIRYRDGFLYIQTEIPALAQQILLMIPNLMDKYQKYLGKGVLKGIKIKIGSIKQSPTKIESAIEQILVLDNPEISVIDSCKMQIEDPELADQFSKLMQKAYLIHKKKKISGGKACLSCGVIIDSEFNYCPCCEMKVNEEIKAYITYQKIHNPNLTQEDPSEITGLSHLQIKKTN